MLNRVRLSLTAMTLALSLAFAPAVTFATSGETTTAQAAETTTAAPEAAPAPEATTAAPAPEATTAAPAATAPAPEATTAAPAATAPAPEATTAAPDAAAATTEAPEAAVEEESPYEGKCVASVSKNSTLNVRKSGSEDATILGKMEKGTMGKVLKKKDGWTKIRSGSVTGWVSNDYLVYGDKIAGWAKKNLSKKATVTTETLNLREKPNTKSDILALLDEDKIYTVKSTKTDGWVKIKAGDDTGYVSADYVDVDYHFGTAKTMEEIREEEEEEASSSSSSSNYSVLSYASQFVGGPYVYGGTSLTGGCDCSGFVMGVFAHFGVYLPHSSSAMRGYGRSVSYSEMQPGDVVCYSGHVGIYAGGGQLLSALGKKWGITYNSVNYKHIITIRRMF